MSGLILLLCALPAAAETPIDSEDPLAGLAPMADESLEEARGGAVVLPNGMVIEVTGTLRVLVDGQEQAALAAGDSAAVGLDLAAQLMNIQQPGIIVNSLDGVSLEQYREINFFVSNLPADATLPNFVPTPQVQLLTP